jgi:hypothetical protein
MKEQLFAHIALPVRPEGSVDGAAIQFSEMAEEPALGVPFFGGYADEFQDFLADLGFDMMETAPEETAVKAKRIQG